MINKDQFFAFIAKFAIICNLGFLTTLLVMFVKSLHFPEAVSNFAAVLGLEMAPFVNLSFIVLLVTRKLKKYPLIIPSWQYIFILLLSLSQLIFLIF